MDNLFFLTPPSISTSSFDAKTLTTCRDHLYPWFLLSHREQDIIDNLTWEQAQKRYLQTPHDVDTLFPLDRLREPKLEPVHWILAWNNAQQLSLHSLSDVLPTEMHRTLIQTLQPLLRIDPWGNLICPLAKHRAIGDWARDHWFPGSRQGNSTPDNLVAMQWSANIKKSNTFPRLMTEAQQAELQMVGLSVHDILDFSGKVYQACPLIDLVGFNPRTLQSDDRGVLTREMKEALHILEESDSFFLRSKVKVKSKGNDKAKQKSKASPPIKLEMYGPPRYRNLKLSFREMTQTLWVDELIHQRLKQLERAIILWERLYRQEKEKREKVAKSEETQQGDVSVKAQDFLTKKEKKEKKERDVGKEALWVVEWAEHLNAFRHTWSISLPESTTTSCKKGPKRRYASFRNHLNQVVRKCAQLEMKHEYSHDQAKELLAKELNYLKDTSQSLPEDRNAPQVREWITKRFLPLLDIRFDSMLE